MTCHSESTFCTKKTKGKLIAFGPSKSIRSKTILVKKQKRVDYSNGRHVACQKITACNMNKTIRLA